MISLLFGTPRCGKTTTLAYFAHRALARKTLVCGRGAWRVSLGDFAPYQHIYSTFPIRDELGEIRQLDCSKLGKTQIENSLILIDEVSLIFDSRDYKTFPKDAKRFFALHGHGKNDILIASQGFEDCDKRVRNLAENLLYIERFGRFSRIRPIQKKWSINGDIVEGYILCPPLSSKYINRSKYYKMFDSYELPELPPDNSPVW